jgi:excisionase family DNA binding protein
MTILDHPLLTLRHLATVLNVSVDTARRLVKRGTIPAYLVAGQYRITPADVHAYLANRRHASVNR